MQGVSAEADFAGLNDHCSILIETERELEHWGEKQLKGAPEKGQYGSRERQSRKWQLDILVTEMSYKFCTAL